VLSFPLDCLLQTIQIKMNDILTFAKMAHAMTNSSLEINLMRLSGCLSVSGLSISLLAIKSSMTLY